MQIVPAVAGGGAVDGKVGDDAPGDQLLQDKAGDQSGVGPTELKL
jgi:hypothetical protein